MKSFKLVTLVVSAHAMIIAMLVLQPGCNTLMPGSDSDDDTPGQKLAKKWNNFLGHSENGAVIFDPSMNAGYTIDSEDCSDPRTHTSRQKPTKPTWSIAMEEKQQDVKPKKTLAANSRKEVLRPIHTAPAQTKSQSTDTFVHDNDVHEIYKVKSGDSLWKIAKKHGVTIDQVLAVNENVTKKSLLKVGQRIAIPYPSQTVNPMSSTKVSDPVDLDGALYTVRQGDSLSVIAQKFNVSINDIQRANNMRNNTIFAGKKIIIPGADDAKIAMHSKPSPKKAATQAKYSHDDETHQVNAGETLSVIAMQYGVDVDDLMAWNDIADARKVRAGQNLVIKGNGITVAKVKPVKTPEPKHQAVEFEEATDFLDDDSMFDLSEEISVVSVTKD